MATPRTPGTLPDQPPDHPSDPAVTPEVQAGVDQVTGGLLNLRDQITGSKETAGRLYDAMLETCDRTILHQTDLVRKATIRQPRPSDQGTSPADPTAPPKPGSGLNKLPPALCLLVTLGLTLGTAGAVYHPKENRVTQFEQAQSREGVRATMVGEAKSLMAADGDFRRAERVLSRAAQEYGLDREVLFDLAYCRLMLKDRKGVADACDRAEELDPLNPYVWTYRGQLKLMDGDKAGARKDFEKAVILGDGRAVYFLRRCG